MKTADCRLQTDDKMQTEGKIHTADQGLNAACNSAYNLHSKFPCHIKNTTEFVKISATTEGIL